MREYLECWRKCVVFSGTATRREFWMFLFVHVAVILAIICSIVGWIVLLNCVLHCVGGTREQALGLNRTVLTWGALVLAGYVLLGVLPTLSVCVRRLRGKGHGAGCVLWPLGLGGVSLVALLCMTIAPSRKNQMKIVGDQMVASPCYGVAWDVDLERKCSGLKFARERGDKDYKIYADVLGDLSNYTFSRRLIAGGALPKPKDVRLDHFVNFFDYGYACSRGDETLSGAARLGDCPWNKNVKLLHVGLKAGKLDARSCPGKKNVVLVVNAFTGGRTVADSAIMRGVADALAGADRVSVIGCGLKPSILLSSEGRCRKEAVWSALSTGLDLGMGGRLSLDALRMALGELGKMLDPRAVNCLIVLSDRMLFVPDTEKSAFLDLLKDERWATVRFSLMSLWLRYGSDWFDEQVVKAARGHAYKLLESPGQVARAITWEMTGGRSIVAEDVTCSVVCGTETGVPLRSPAEDADAGLGDFGAGRIKTLLYEMPCSAMGPTNGGVKVVARWREPGAAEYMSTTIPVRSADCHEQEVPKDSFDFCAAVAETALLLSGSLKSDADRWQGVLARACASVGDDRTGTRTEFVRLIRKVVQMPYDRRNQRKVLKGRSPKK